MRNACVLLFFLALPLPAVELPIVFEPNVGQTDPRVKYLSRGPGATLFLTGEEAVLALSGQVLRIRLEGAGPGTAAALEPLPGVTHYYRGNDPSQWRANVPQHGRVRFAGVYPGIDLDWYAREGSFEFDFVLAPGADPGTISLAFEGTERLELSDSGDLVLHLPGGSLIFERPFSWQEVDGERREIASRYLLKEGRIGFELAEWDRSRPLVIDPLLVWSSYLGGRDGDERVHDVAVDAGGSLYATGTTSSPDFPGASVGFLDNTDVFVTRLDELGRNIVFTTLLDGEDSEVGTSIAVDGKGAAYVTGQTFSDKFPLANAFQEKFNPGVGLPIHPCDAFVTKLTASGGIVFSTYLGGADWDTGEAIALDADDRVYVAGWSFSGNFPLVNPFPEGDLRFPGSDAFLSVLSADGQSLDYSTLLRGATHEEAFALAVDAAGNAYVAGRTESKDFPVKGQFQGDQGGTDAFVAKIDPSASGAASLVYSTYLGGPGTDAARGVAVDSLGQAHVTGTTGSAAFPLVRPLDQANAVNEAFVATLNAQGNALLFSTFLGGSATEKGSSIAVDGSGALYVLGHTDSPDFPAVNAFQPELQGGLDVFVAKIDPAGPALLWSSYHGGSEDEEGEELALDLRANVYLGGRVESERGFPAFGGVQDTFGGGSGDGFLAKIEATPPDTIGVFRESEGKNFLRNSNATGNADLTVTLGQAGDLPLSGNWTGFGDRPGVFRAGTFILKRFNNDLTCCNLTFAFGEAGDLPVGGDWDGDGIDTVGLFRPSTGEFFLTDTNGPIADRTFLFGQSGDLPVAGDWNGDGIDTVGVFRPSTGEFLLTDSDGLEIDHQFVFGQSGDVPLAGDWNGDGVDTIGVLRSGFQFLLRNQNAAGPPALVFVFGLAGDLPLAGDWDGRP